MPKPLLIYKMPNNAPAINRIVNASWLNDSVPIKWNRENKTDENSNAKNWIEKCLIDLKRKLIKL